MKLFDKLKDKRAENVLRKLLMNSEEYEFNRVLMKSFLEQGDKNKGFVVGKLVALANRRTTKGYLFGDMDSVLSHMSLVYEHIFRYSYDSALGSLNNVWNELYPEEQRTIYEMNCRPYLSVERKCKRIKENYLEFLKKFFKNKETREITEEDIRPLVVPYLTLD